MKMAALVVAGLGVLVLLLGLYGRFHGPPSVYVAGESFAASTFLALANVVLTIAVLIAVLFPQNKKQE